MLSCTILVNGANAAVEISDGTVRTLYHFEDTVDSSGHGYNLTVGAGGSFTCTGKLSGCWDSISATAASNYLTAVSSSQNISGDYAMGFWIKYPANPNAVGGYVIAPGTAVNSGAHYGYARMCAAGQAEMKAGNTCVADTHSPTIDQWYWVLANRHGSILDFYIDNQLFKSGTAADTTALNGLMRFNGEIDDTVGLDFHIDEYFFIDDDISTSTRNALYASGAGAEICVTAGCASAGGSSSATTTATLGDITAPLSVLDFIIDFLGFMVLLGGGFFAYKKYG